MTQQFDFALGLDGSQALAMLAMSYQVRPKLKDESVTPVAHVEGLYVIPDICMGKGASAKEYTPINGYLLDFDSHCTFILYCL